jgi:hypothetical protein
MAQAGENDRGRGRRWGRWLGGVVLTLLCLPALASAGAFLGAERKHWSTARRDSAGIAPRAADTPEAVLQVYAARAWGWRGILGSHTWFAVKPTGAAHYTRHEVIGWYAYRGGSAVVERPGIPDAYWFGSKPKLLMDLRGEGVDALIDKVAAAARTYPFANEYTVWPGPNSNTFTAHVARLVPELRLDLPPTAIGKDFLTDGSWFGPSPSGTGYQLSLFGLLGITVAREEGIELNFLGLVIGIDFAQPALKLPGLGRLGAGS